MLFNVKTSIKTLFLLKNIKVCKNKLIKYDSGTQDKNYDKTIYDIIHSSVTTK